MLNPLRGEKIKILLEEIELQDRIYKKDMKVNDLEFIDYSKVENRLKKLRDKSEAYLNRALRKVEEYEK